MPSSGDYKGNSGSGNQVDCHDNSYTAYAMNPYAYFSWCNNCSANTYLDSSGLTYTTGSYGNVHAVTCENCPAGQIAPPSQTTCTATTTTTTITNTGSTSTFTYSTTTTHAVSTQQSITSGG